MTTKAFNTTVLFYPNKNPKLRLFALWYFTTLMIVWNLVGHTVLGFEQSWATPLTAIATAILVSLFLDWVDARSNNRELRFSGSLGNFLNFLPACLIPGFACAMLLYANERLWPVIFAVVLSMGSKLMVRAPVGNRNTQHIFNPSNFGVATTLGLFTGRLPLVGAWIGGFILQGLVRAKLFGTPLIVPLMPMTSAAFIVFTLYMIPDPATTPLKPGRQALFGFSVAMVYALTQMMHIVFGLFFALVIVCTIRGLSLHIWAWRQKGQKDTCRREPEPEAA